MEQGQWEDNKRRTMEETGTGRRKKRIQFKERMGVCGCRSRRTDNGGRIADGVWWRATTDRGLRDWTVVSSGKGRQ